MNLTAIVDYFDNLCRKNKLVAHSDNDKHFFQINILDIMQGNVKGLKYPAVLLEVPEGGYQGDTLDNTLYVKTIALSFVTYVEMTDVAAQVNAYEAMEVIGRQFMSRIAKDYKNKSTIKVFRHNQVRCYKLSGVMDSCYGWRFEIPIGEIAKEMQVYTANDWLTD